jgi:hypothetical protein
MGPGGQAQATKVQSWYMPVSAVVDCNYAGKSSLAVYPHGSEKLADFVNDMKKV